MTVVKLLAASLAGACNSPQPTIEHSFSCESDAKKAAFILATQKPTHFFSEVGALARPDQACLLCSQQMAAPAVEWLLGCFVCKDKFALTKQRACSRCVLVEPLTRMLGMQAHVTACVLVRVAEHFLFQHHSTALFASVTCVTRTMPLLRSLWRSGHVWAQHIRKRAPPEVQGALANERLDRRSDSQLCAGSAALHREWPPRLRCARERAHGRELRELRGRHSEKQRRRKRRRIHPERMASTGRQRGWIHPPLAPVESDADAPAEIEMAEMYDVMNVSLPSEPLQFQDEHGLPAFTRPPYQPIRHAGRYHSHCWRNQESTIK